MLDVDGVIGFVLHENGKSADWRKRIVRVAVARLNRIVARSGAAVVVSSNWRYIDSRPGPPEKRGYTATQMQLVLDTMGFRGRVIGITPALPGPGPAAPLRGPDLRGHVRGLEIRAWLDAQAELPRGLAILDDWELPAALYPWLIRTDYNRLLDDDDVESAVETLQMPFHVRRWRAAASALVGEGPAAMTSTSTSEGTSTCATG